MSEWEVIVRWLSKATKFPKETAPENIANQKNSFVAIEAPEGF
jgi:hypothetical protein